MVETVAPVLDVRIVNDKFTGQPRGFAFVHFASIADATRALHAFNVRSVICRDTYMSIKSAV
jgi:RNA-binding protein 5/10